MAASFGLPPVYAPLPMRVSDPRLARRLASWATCRRARACDELRHTPYTGASRRAGARMERGALPPSRLFVPLIALAVILAVGTLGYVLIEGFPLLDAVYMAVTTMT